MDWMTSVNMCSLGVALDSKFGCQRTILVEGGWFWESDCDSIGVDSKVLSSMVAPAMKRMDWDFYDVRRAQLKLLDDHFGAESMKIVNDGSLEELYLHGSVVGQVSEALALLPQGLAKSFHALVPYRRRAFDSFTVFVGDCSVEIYREPSKAFEMNVEDIRRLPRRFQSISSEILDLSEFRNIIASLTIILAQETTCNRFKVGVHLMRLEASADQLVSNSPEGIHQDGSDYIVSALVVERENVTGGESRIYAGDWVKPLFAKTLGVGDFVLQSDSRSPLWHEVTPIGACDTACVGVRSIIGFDFISI